MEQSKVYEQHAENKEFLSKLIFYKEEIQIFQNRLDEIARKNNTSAFLMELEHFQNQLLIQRNNIDEIKHKVNIDENRLQKEIEKNEVAIQHRIVEPHTAEKEEVSAFELNFKELKHELTIFFTKWM